MGRQSPLGVASSPGEFLRWEPSQTPKLFSPFCHTILDEDYEILSGLPDSVLYTCGPCAGATQPRWREALSGALQGGLRQVLQGLLSSKVAVPLLLCSQVWRGQEASWVGPGPTWPLLTSVLCAVWAGWQTATLGTL